MKSTPTLATLLASPLHIGRVTLRNRVILAPMSGVSDLAMRKLAFEHGAGAVVAEMVPGGELVQGRAESERRILPAGGRPHIVQLAGRNAELMAEGARIAAGEGADIIDINMGCPARKVTGGDCGSALMREPEIALAIIEHVVAAVEVPVTVKMRLGWDDEQRNAPVLARLAEEAGAALITVHGRTRCQFYKGSADWQAIAEVRDAISIPLVVNGDIGSLDDSLNALAASKADAIMVGRAHYGAPWAAGALAAEAGATHPRRLPPADLASYVAEHYEAMLSLYGSARGMRHARKHLGWYSERHLGHRGAAARARLMAAADPGEVLRLIGEVFSGGVQTDLAA